MRRRRELRQLDMFGGSEVVASLDLQPGWGGARPGAGRKKSGRDTVVISVRIDRYLADLARHDAELQGQSLSEWLAQLISDDLGSLM